MSGNSNQASSNQRQTPWVTRHQHAQLRTATAMACREEHAPGCNQGQAKVTSRLCGTATSAQLNSHIVGQLLYSAEPRAHIARTAPTSVCACTTHLQPQHLKQSNTGTTARISKCQSRSWQAAALGLSGNAWPATWSGKRPFTFAPATGLGVPGALNEAKSSSLAPHFLKLSLPAWPSESTSAMTLRTSTPTTLLLAATSRCTGSAHAVKKVSRTAGQQCQTVA